MAPSKPWWGKLQRCHDCTHHFLAIAPQDQAVIDSAYDAHYAGYRRDPYFEAVIAEELQTRFVSLCPPPARLLDVGCGNGAFLAAARTVGYDVFGTDFSPDAVKLCLDQNLAAQAGDFLTLSLPGPFDIITMWDLVEHLRAPEDFLRRAVQLLKPGGWLMLKTPATQPATFPFVRAWSRLAPGLLHAPAHVQYYNDRSLTALLQRCGYSDITRWPSRGFRSPPTGAASLKRKISRRLTKAMNTFAGNGNLYWVARVTSKP